MMTEQQGNAVIGLLTEIRDLLVQSRECQAASAVVLMRVCDEIERPRLLREHLEAQSRLHLEESERERARATAKAQLDQAETRRTTLWAGGAGILSTREGLALPEGGPDS